VTAPKDVNLPGFVYDMEELRNDAEVHRKRKNDSKDQGRKRQKMVSYAPPSFQHVTGTNKSKQEPESETEEDESDSGSGDDDDEYDSEVDDDAVMDE
jgi:hypothetical protein